MLTWVVAHYTRETVQSLTISACYINLRTSGKTSVTTQQYAMFLTALCSDTYLNHIALRRGQKERRKEDNTRYK
jgi:hypothetical protein